MQNCRLPSFFLTNTTALYQALWLVLIAPDCSIAHRWFQTSSTSGGAIHLSHSLKGVPSVTFIMCSIEWVQPNSVGPNESTSWYSARSQQVASASPRGQESNPLKSNSSNNFPCLCLTINLGVWGAGAHHPLLQLSLHGWFGHWQCHNCPGHWGFLSEDLWGKPYCSLPPWLHFYFLASALCTCLYGDALQQRAIFSL